MRRRPPRRPPSLIDPLLDWLALDGAGFHDGFNSPERHFERHHRPRSLSGTAADVFDQGLGRSLWFVRGADVERIGTTIAGLAEARREHLWSGVGSAAAYAGGVGEDSLRRMRELASGYASDVAQGAAFAAKARLLGGNATASTELACSILCGTSARDAAAYTDGAREGLSTADNAAAYAAWRIRVRGVFAE